MATSTIKARVAVSAITYTGTYTVPSSCYINIANGTEEFKGHGILSVNLISWTSSTGAFTVASNNGNEVYLLANNGVRVVNPAIRVTYLV